MSNLVSTKQAALLSGLGERRITVLAAQGRIQGRKVSGRWRIDPASVKAYQESNALPVILDQPERLEALYREAGSYIAAAEVIGCDKKTVAKAIKRHGIKPNPSNFAHRPRRPRRLRTTALHRKQRKWLDMAIIFLERGLRPVPMADLCPPNCPGRSECLDGGPCVYHRRAGHD